MADLLVLCYHGISETWETSEAVRPDDLEGQLAGFLRRGYRAATLSDALSSPLSEKTLVVTFDDAHRSVLELAEPIMAKLEVPGTVYVPTDYPGTDRPMAWEGYDTWLGTEHEAELSCLGWEELGGMVAKGWEVGSHTCSHPRLSKLGDAEIEAELKDSRKECEANLGVPCTSFAYPYSDYDERAVRAAADAGYRFAVTVPRQPRSPLPLEWPRVGVFRGENPRRIRLRARSRRLGPSPQARGALAIRRMFR